MIIRKKAIAIGLVIVAVVAAGFAYWKNKDKIKEARDTAEHNEQAQENINEVQKQLRDIEGQNVTDGDKYQLQMELGANLYSLGKLDEAKVAYESAVKLQPDNPIGYIALFKVVRDQKDYAKADETITKAVVLRHDDWNLWRDLIDFKKYLMKASKEDLAKLYKEALAGTGESINIVTVYAKFLEESGDLKGAIEQWKKAIEKNQAGKEMYQKEIDRIQEILDK